MNRDITKLCKTKFDVLIVGTGIHGAYIARAAVLNGLKVCLIDKSDIGSGTSHNSLKILHGGVRYIQHLNIKRTLQSIREQLCFKSTLHGRTRYVGFLMPTFGYGMRGPIAMWVGLQFYNFLTFLMCVWLKQPFPDNWARVVSRKKCIEMAEFAIPDGVTGGAIWYELQVEQADRALLDIVIDSAENGCCVASYVSASSLRSENNMVIGAHAYDEITGASLVINAALVVNATGPSAVELLANEESPLKLPQSVPVSKSMNLVVDRPANRYAIGLQSPYNSDSVVGETRRLYFLTPWKGYTILGTSHSSTIINSSDLQYSDNDINEYLQDINKTFPSLNLKMSDVLYCYQGLTPLESSDQRKADSLHESLIVDHELTQARKGLISVVGVKWTTARLVSESVMSLIAQKLQIPRPESTLLLATKKHAEIPLEIASSSDDDIVKFCLLHLRETMALKLADILLRRTDDFILGRLTNHQIALIGQTMADSLKWDSRMLNEEYTALLSASLPEVRKQQLIKCREH